ncbi:MAG: class I SAM-dependent methyltransferase [Chloroflexaceae bacterium]|nr:class I SAM-dependent methyltransferase [Chloroflexaceae bacterium]
MTDYPRVIVQAEREVAYSSPDHILPRGTRTSNSRNMRFNRKLEWLFPRISEPLKILDLGCSGGGFVKDCLDTGNFAVGLEGSDFSKRYRRAEWATIPDYLFTCDISGAFDIFLQAGGKTERLLFDVVTTWEVIEHIAEPDLPQVAANVRQHLLPSGLWIMSVSPCEEVINGIRLHQTVRPRSWWINTFRQLGFEHIEAYVAYFNTQFVRGPKYDSPGGFHLVLSPDITQAPVIPQQSLSRRFFDWWIGSSPQKLLKRLVIGDTSIHG